MYPFGIDWTWSISENETEFTNSFKMKFSIIIGVTHMILGILMKIQNAHFENKIEDLFFEGIPQLFFMLCTFGYMVFCIIFKWL